SPSSPVAFSGSYGGTVSHTANPLENLLDGTGSSTYLGQGVSKGTVVITGFDGSTCPGGIANEQYVTLTAANGDTLSFHNHDIACPVAATAGLYHGTGRWEVTGGIGQFTNTNGQGTLDGQIDLVRLTFSFNLSGAITPRAPLR
ncbi:MAG: hypothetical protein WCI21_09630, partial [Alphaproteobacteria bacterium]